VSALKLLILKLNKGILIGDVPKHGCTRQSVKPTCVERKLAFAHEVEAVAAFETLNLEQTFQLADSFIIRMN
jgi:hypothetical protein